MNNRIKTVIAILGVSLVCLLVTSCDFFQFGNKLPDEDNGQTNANPVPDDAYYARKMALNTELGMPVYKGDVRQTDENHWLISRPGYTLSFNHERNIPNWVCWHIEEDDVGHLERPKNKFTNDPLIKKGWEPVMYFDYHYSNYGFDRGHMCPNGDRNNDRQNQLDTFYMTNMVPQAGENNQHAWAYLERAIRDDYVANNMEVYVVSGPSLQNGGTTVKKTGKYSHPGGTWDHITSTHNNGKKVRIDVPAYTWKVIIAIPVGEDDVARINANPGIAEVYAVWMDNSDVVCKGKSYDDFLVSIDFVEEMTGLDFFPFLEDAVEAQLESLNSEFDPVLVPTFIYEEPELDEAA